MSSGAARTDRAAVPAALDDFAADVRYYLGLQPRQLPSKYLYDDLGSALFEAITHLPWYPLARAEARLLTVHGADVFRALGRVSTLVELGPGNGSKLSGLLDAAGPLVLSPRVHLVDVSASALTRAAQLLGHTKGLDVVLHPTTYETGLEQVATATRGAGRILALFLGSNIGNFDPPGCHAFLRQLHASLRPGDALLVGADLVKPEPDLKLAYDDPLGITAAFNRNLLVRLQRELEAALDLDAFVHRAVWNADESRVEMHLAAREATRVVIASADLDLEMAAGESIWTESSYKYEADALEGTLRRCGFQPAARWIDARDKFALLLGIRTETT